MKPRPNPKTYSSFIVTKLFLVSETKPSLALSCLPEAFRIVIYFITFSIFLPPNVRMPALKVFFPYLGMFSSCGHVSETNITGSEISKVCKTKRLLNHQLMSYDWIYYHY